MLWSKHFGVLFETVLHDSKVLDGRLLHSLSFVYLLNVKLVFDVVQAIRYVLVHVVDLVLQISLDGSQGFKLLTRNAAKLALLEVLINLVDHCLVLVWDCLVTVYLLWRILVDLTLNLEIVPFMKYFVVNLAWLCL